MEPDLLQWGTFRPLFMAETGDVTADRVVAAILWGGRPMISILRKRTRPPVGSIEPQTQLKIVVLSAGRLVTVDFISPVSDI